MSLSDIKQIGIIGGSASSLMLCMEAAKLGIRTCLLDPKVDCVGSRVANEHIIAPITNENIKKMSLRCDCVLYNTKPNFEIDVKLHSPIYPNKDNIKELYDFKNIMDLLELLEIPTAKIYYQENNQDAFKQVEGLTMPFRFIKQYKGYAKQMDIFTKSDLTEFILEVDEDAECFILQPISDYKQVVACICIVDEKGKIYQYHPIEESTESEESCKLSISDKLSKNMITKLAKYNRKLLKELKTVGVYTIKYGVKSNKSVEFIEITPELGVGSLLTLDAYGTSVFEEYIRLVTGMKLVTPEFLSYVHGMVKTAKNQFEPNDEGHMYSCGIANFSVYRERENQ